MKKSILFLSALALVSCSKSKDFSKVKNGMTKAQVVAAVGEPTTKVAIGDVVSQWKYDDSDHHIVVFDNETVSNITDDKAMQEGMDKLKKVMDSVKDANK